MKNCEYSLKSLQKSLFNQTASFFSCRNSKEQKHPNYTRRQFCVLDIVTNKIIPTSNFTRFTIQGSKWAHSSKCWTVLLDTIFACQLCKKTLWCDRQAGLKLRLPLMLPILCWIIQRTRPAAGPGYWALHTMTSIFSTELIQTHTKRHCSYI